MQKCSASDISCSVYGRLDFFMVCMFLQQLNMSSIVPCEESETQLYIVNSLEVRSDEICAESVLSADDAALGSKAVKGDAVDRNLRPRTIITKQQDTANNTSIHRQPPAKMCSNVSSNQKSSCASTSGDADCLHESQSTSRRSDAETDTGDTHCPVQKNVCQPDAVTNKLASNLNLSLQV